jgi:hypothetical protein
MTGPSPIQGTSTGVRLWGVRPPLASALSMIQRIHLTERGRR